jgi:hypothetical protein
MLASGAGVAQSVQYPATGWKTGRSSFDPRQRRKDFSSSLSTTDLGPTHTPVQSVLGVLSLGIKHGWDVTLTTYPNIVPR